MRKFKAGDRVTVPVAPHNDGSWTPIVGKPMVVTHYDEGAGFYNLEFEIKYDPSIDYNDIAEWLLEEDEIEFTSSGASVGVNNLLDVLDNFR